MKCVDNLKEIERQVIGNEIDESIDGEKQRSGMEAGRE